MNTTGADMSAETKRDAKHTPGPRIGVSRREHPEVRLDDFAVSAGDLCVAVVATEGEAKRIAEALTLYRDHDAWHGLRAEMLEVLGDMVRRFAPSPDGLSEAQMACAQRAFDVIAKAIGEGR